MYYDVFVSVNLPSHEEVAYQVKNVTLEEATAVADMKYPTWTSLDLKVLRAGTIVGEPA